MGLNISYIHDMEHKQIINSSELYDNQEMEGHKHHESDTSDDIPDQNLKPNSCFKS